MAEGNIVGVDPHRRTFTATTSTNAVRWWRRSTSTTTSPATSNVSPENSTATNSSFQTFVQ